MNTDGHGLFATRGHKGHKGRKGPKRAACRGAGNPWRDLIALAFAREREARRWLRWPLEYDSVYAHVFKCVCCGKTRPEEHRREPRSEVCVHCVREAGF
jgi:hypothetical protein